MKRVHIFWDNSNIFISGQSVCGSLEYGKEMSFRINFNNLIDLAADNRVVEQIFCVGSVPPASDGVWSHIKRKTGKEPELYERGAFSGAEQGVDQTLQVRMLRLGFDYTPPETIILLTGDGSGFEDNVGFFADIKRLHLIGWGVEVVAWKNHCNRKMREWVENNGVFVPLDGFYKSVTFLEGLRSAVSLNISARPRQVNASGASQ